MSIHAAALQTPCKTQSTKMAATPPTIKRSARASRSKKSRIHLAVTQEDFSAQLAAVDSDEEDQDDDMLGTQGGSGSSPRKPARDNPPKTTDFVSTDGWKMPHIAPTSSQEEAIMLAAMSDNERADIENTFINRLQVSP